MKILIEGTENEVAGLLRKWSEENPTIPPGSVVALCTRCGKNPCRCACPCGENLCPGNPCPICGEGNCTGGEECEGPGWAKGSDGVIDDLKAQIRNLEFENRRIAEDLTTWKAAAANNYELYLRTVREAGAEKDRLAEEMKGLKERTQGVWLSSELHKRLEACRDAVVLFRKQWDKNGCLKPSKSEPIHLAVYDAAEPFMATGEPREFIE